NVIVEASGNAKPIDFGLVGTTESPDDPEQCLGTLLYAAPEQMGILKRSIDGRTDLYALGCTLYACAAGTPPFMATSAAELIRQHAATSPPDLSAAKPYLSLALVAIVAKLLCKDADDRYQSAEGLVADFDRIADLNAEAAASGQSPALGKNDVAAYRYEIPLVGRDAEL